MKDFRYERKFVVSDLKIKDILLSLKQHPLMFKEIFYERTINNIYFDTPDLHNYFENIDGAPNRNKVRVRWYGNNTGEAYLEIKSKTGYLNRKKKYKIGKFDINGNINTTFNKTLKTAGIPDHVKVELYKLVPSTYNNYKRRYFLSQDGRFRVTLDYDMSFKRILSSKLSLGYPDRTGKMIIELKYSVKDEKNLNYFTRSFPFRLGKFSKYTFGVGSV